MENLKTQLEQIGREMSARRHLIPEQNRRKYDIEARDFFENLTAAAEDGDTAHFNRLVQLWNNRQHILTVIPNCYKVPPALVRRKNESQEDYIDRCYNTYWKENPEK